MSKNFIKQTAKDYDMDYKTVQRIYETEPNTFYAKLEAYIKNEKKGELILYFTTIKLGGRQDEGSVEEAYSES